MKISVNDEQLFTLSELQKKVIGHYYKDQDSLEKDLKGRLQWIIMHKYEHCIKELRKEWLPKLAQAGVVSIPVDDESFAHFLFEHPCYKKDLQIKIDVIDQFDLEKQKAQKVI